MPKRIKGQVGRMAIIVAMLTMVLQRSEGIKYHNIKEGPKHKPNSNVLTGFATLVGGLMVELPLGGMVQELRIIFHS